MKQAFTILSFLIGLSACDQKGLNSRASDSNSLMAEDSTNIPLDTTFKSENLDKRGENFLKIIDIDKDNLKDTVYIDIKTSTISCKLSSNNFEKKSSKPIEMLNFDSGLKATKNGFEFYNNWMRAGYKNQFRYNHNKKKVELIGMSRYYYGNAVGDWGGESSVNLLTGDYIGNWYFFDVEADSLLKMPTIRSKMELKSVFLEGFNEGIYFNYLERCSELYNNQKGRMIEHR